MRKIKSLAFSENARGFMEIPLPIEINPKVKSKYTEIFLTSLYFLGGLNNGGKLKGKKNN